MEILKTILWGMSLPFVYMHFLIKFLLAKNKARKYAKNPDDFLDDEKYDTVFKLAKLLLYTRHIPKDFYDDKNSKLLQKTQLIIANHRSLLDPVLLYVFIYKKCSIRPIFVAKKELKDSKIGFILDLIDTIYLDRENLREGIKSIETQVNTLKNNKSIVIFPEGKRNVEEDLLEFKSGALESAYKTMVPIQPIVIAHAEDYLDNRKTVKKKDRKEISFNILDPLQPSSFIHIERNILAKNLRNTMQDVYKKKR